jgi:hypothetical protein
VEAMTEAEWLACSNSLAMAHWLYVNEKAERRQFGHFFAACCSCIRPSIAEVCNRRIAECVDADDEDLQQMALTDAQFHIFSAIDEAIRAIGNRQREFAALSALLRDIVGPRPFRPIIIDPRWRTSTVVDLARTICDQKAFDRMPILADALLDAGCDNEEIITHCCHSTEHVRGCWVVDLLLAKE